jgi:flagellum-specific ATP synthase
VRALVEQIDELDGIEVYGRVVGVRGLMVEVAGPLHAMSVGARVVIETLVQGKLIPIPCEVVGFSGGNALLMPFAPLEGIRRGCRAVVSGVRARRLIRIGPRLPQPMPASGSALRSTSAFARSTPSSPVVTASAPASSPAPASASPCCFR